MRSWTVEHRPSVYGAQPAGVRDLSFESGDVVQAKVFDDAGKPQGEVLLQHAPSETVTIVGDVGVFRFLGCSNGDYAWWMTRGGGHPLLGK